ncbi:MAG: FeoB small GTPase domain-containing protein [Fimbriimonadales bacterium]
MPEKHNEFDIDREKFDHVIALAGNPNTGKSTVFNAFTGLRQHTGNWPGKTVARAEGTLRFNGKRFKLIDLPGTYSLLSTAVDEEIARDFVLFGRPDTTVVVVDATNIERNLNLVLQILEITDRVVVCLNLMDEADRRGIVVDHEQLAKDLGVPVIPCVARTKKGLPELAAVIEGVASGEIVTCPRRIATSAEVDAALDELVPAITKDLPGLPNARWVAMRLLDGDERVAEAVRSGELRKWLERAKKGGLDRLTPQEATS